MLQTCRAEAVGRMQGTVLSQVQLSVTPWAAAHQAPLSMGVSRQESWSGLSCPPPGDLLDPGIQAASLAAGDRGIRWTPPCVRSGKLWGLHRTGLNMGEDRGDRHQSRALRGFRGFGAPAKSWAVTWMGVNSVFLEIIQEVLSLLCHFTVSVA